MTDASTQDWLSIHAASRMLGVHIGTIRTWADTGVLPSYRTPGGHRRFAAADIQSFLRERQHSKHRPNSPSEHVLGQVRNELLTHPLAHESWFRHLSFEPTAAGRTQQREFGQHLLECIVAYVEEPGRRDEISEQGRTLAHAYGCTLAANGLSAGNAARATIHFRQLILKAVLEAKLGARTGDVEDARLFQDVSAFLDGILLAMLDQYE